MTENKDPEKICGIAYNKRVDEFIAQGDSHYGDNSPIVHTNLQTGEKTVFDSDELSVPGNLYEDVMKLKKYNELSKFRKWLKKLKRRWRVRNY